MINLIQIELKNLLNTIYYAFWQLIDRLHFLEKKMAFYIEL